ncbi:hypothetical protein CJF42_04280 [Pseudoalteromonas sp. NBT06-2]|uniref:c-type cytochrome n=1 Tax=Pseudoalteromonas sp. NBT06-2 TaxID=2025950 RepID=UPI000BA5F4EF|nr:c-type cytochrome [Pseudoalteromonas sp. NBT06-2]PAJ75543.1 hypothetical protein CJF42_04280 [Pseudoalteromonas sp. NBT06-2]
MKTTNILIVIYICTLSLSTFGGEFDNGAKIYSYSCVLCHGNKGMGDGYLPMKIKDYPSTNLFENIKSKDRENLIKVISQGFLYKDVDAYMPPWKDELSKREIADLADFIIYLRTDTLPAINLLEQYLNKIKRSVRIGELIFQTRCILCHGKQGRGDGRLSKIIKSPPPANLTISQLPTESMKAIISYGGQNVGRSSKMPPWGDFLTDSEIQALIDYVKTLRE